MNPVELTSVAGVVIASISGIFIPPYLQRRKDRAVDRSQANRGDASLRDDQREFIQVLQQENQAWRIQVKELQETITRLRVEVDQLRGELAVERRSREATEARNEAESGARTRLRISSSADEREITAAGDAAEQKSRDDNPE